MIISLFVSCNDGEEGLFQMAANSVKKESFKILNIINKTESGNIYIVATDNGIAKYNIDTRFFSDFKGNGVMAKYAIWASRDGSEFIYYDSNTGFYYNEKGEKEEMANLEGKIPQPFYSTNGTEFTYVFKEKDGSKYYSLFLDSPLSKEAFKAKDLSLIDIDNIGSVSIIGNGVLRVNADKKTYTYHADPDLGTLFGKSILTNSIVHGVSDDGLYLTKDGFIGIYSNPFSTENAKTIGFTINKRPAMYSIFDDSHKPIYSYFIPEGSSSIIEVKWDGEDFTKATKTVTGLQNITVIAIIGKDDNKLIVLTANSGVQELDMK